MLVNPTGSKLWRLKYRIDGREKLLAIGAYPAVALAAARAKRDEAKTLLASGTDPSQIQKESRKAEEDARNNTFRLVADEYLAKLRSEGRAVSTMGKVEWLLSFVPDSLADMPLRSISAPMNRHHVDGWSRSDGDERQAKCASTVAKPAGIPSAEPILVFGVENLLRRRLSPHHSVFRLGRNLAILPSVSGGWAVHLGNVGSIIGRYAMTIVKLMAALPVALLVSTAVAGAADGSDFPIGTWGQTAKHCAIFQAGGGADAMQITPTERSYRESEGQLVKEPIVSITRQANGRFRITWKPYPDSSSWEDVWTTDGGKTMLAQGENEPPSIPVRKYVACTDKAAPAPGDFGKWKTDPNPNAPHATLDSGPNFPRIEVSCVGQDALGYKFTMADGRFPQSITMPGAEGDINLVVNPSGFMPQKNAARFVGAIAGLIKEAKSYGDTTPESAFVTQLGINGGIPSVVPIGGLMAVREWLRPLCASAKAARPLASSIAGTWQLDLNPDTPPRHA